MNRTITMVMVAIIAIGILTGCAPTWYTYQITSDPSEADLLVDGQLVCSTPCSINRKRSTSITVVARKDDYKTASVVLQEGVYGNKHFNLVVDVKSIPKEPEVNWEVTVDSVPSAVVVYGLRPDGKTLGSKLGTTPCTISIGLAEPYLSSGQRYQNDLYLQVFGPANARKSEFDKKRNGRDIIIDLALYDAPKDRWIFLPEYVVGFLKDFNHNPWPPEPITVTVPFGVATPKQAIGKSSDFKASSRKRSQDYEQTTQECERAKQDYSQAVTAYNREKATRDTRNNESTAASIGALGNGPGALLMGLFANTTRNDANISQKDMNHALRLMQDAKGRMSIHCGN